MEEGRGLFWGYRGRQFEHDFSPTLPTWYSREEFLNDVYAMFIDKFVERGKARPPAPPKRWGRPAFEEARARDPIGFTKWEWADYQRFFVLAYRSRIVEWLVGHTRSPAQAAAIFLDILKNLPRCRDPRTCPVGDIPLPFLHDRQPGEGHYGLKNIADRVLLMKAYERLKPILHWARQDVVDYEETLWPEDDVDVNTIRSVEEAARAIPTELADDLWDVKVATQSLLKAEYRRYIYRGRRIAVLIDVSGSMEEDKRYVIANAVVMAIADLVRESRANEMIVVPFDADVHEPIAGSPDEIKRRIMESLLYSGGGTSIDKALRYADEELRADDIVLVTDGEDYVEYKPRAKLHTIFVADEVNETLAEISDEFRHYRPSDVWG